MLLDSNAIALGLPEAEQKEILAAMPPLSPSHHVLDLGAGIGRHVPHWVLSHPTPRYTKVFALAVPSGHVVATDIVARFIAENSAMHSALGNITFLVSDANHLEFPPTSFDLIFANWLLMYLSDPELTLFATRLKDWIRPGGYFFSRESCEHAISGVKNPSSIVRYRGASEYKELFLGLGLVLVREGYLKTYKKVYNNPNQRWWCWRRPER